MDLLSSKVLCLLGAPFTDDSVGTIVGTFKNPRPKAGGFLYIPLARTPGVSPRGGANIPKSSTFSTIKE